MTESTRTRVNSGTTDQRIIGLMQRPPSKEGSPIFPAARVPELSRGKLQVAAQGTAVPGSRLWKPVGEFISGTRYATFMVRREATRMRAEERDDVSLLHKLRLP